MMSPTSPIPLQTLKTLPPGAVLDKARSSIDFEQNHGERGPFLICRACGQRITPVSARMSVSGQYEHTFFNPHGLVFVLGCFAMAPGCGLSGMPSSEFTWFPGYFWQPAHCRACLQHLGWRYTGESSGFFGLILDQLTEEPDQRAS